VSGAAAVALAIWLAWLDLTKSGPNEHEALRWSALAVGSAIAFKFFVFVLPMLLYVILARPSRLLRATHALVFMTAGIVISSLGFDSTTSLYRAAMLGTHYNFEFDRVKGALIYLVELPGIFSLPLLVAAAAGTVGLLQRLRAADPRLRRHALAVFGSVPVIGLAFVLLKLDNFARHWVFLIPWAALAGGWFLARVSERLKERGRSPALVLAPVFLWMAAFVVDGERFFIFEPRNDALRWLHEHVPQGTTLNWMGRRVPEGYRSVRWMVEGEPDVLVFEMFEANQSLSGVNWRDSYPSDWRQVYDGRSAERVAAIQSLFRGTSDYAVVARFPDGYVMPEYRLGMTLLGDRARSYITEVVIFRRTPKS